MNAQVIPIARARRQPPRRVPALGSLNAIAEVLLTEGLGPILDEALELIRAECPDCRAGARDPLGLYRPLVVTTRGHRTSAHCEACGGHSDV